MRSRLTRGGMRIAPLGMAALLPIAVLVAGAPLAGVAGADEHGAEQIRNGDFSAGVAPWWAYGTAADPEVVDGRLCVPVPGGLENPWDAGVGQSDVVLEADEGYTFSFEAEADPSASVRVVVQLQTEPWTEQFAETVSLDADAEPFSFEFASDIESDQHQVVFQVGGAAEPWTFCLDDVSLRGGTEIPPYEPDTGPRVRVNQVGYLPDAPKHATLVTEETEPLSWQLADDDGTVIATGTSQPRGVDGASQQNVHTIDFSDITDEGRDYTLTADDQTSLPFAIAGDIFAQLRYDALQFFYIQRSGIAIDGDLVGAEYARPAGHVGVPPNQGDTDVPCQPGVCNYRLDVSGGWYDAGDHGKYVVNGGLATYQLLATFERTKTAPSARPDALGDGRLAIPESGNGVPDILDEARWQLEFLMRMQVPEDEPLAGMAHHKIHDNQWAPDAMLPHDNPLLRELHPPSTAATLNLAAVTAQCARLYAPYDKAFADRCLRVARIAYDAALANPDHFADPADSTGGGAYSDDDVSDEFYWAAVELYLTTGQSRYRTDVLESPHHEGDVFSVTGYNWPDTAALGRLDLATVPNRLSLRQANEVQQSVVEAADRYLATIADEAYGVSFPGDPANYFWGSNSNVINNLIVLATAYDLTGDRKYRDGALEGMDYIFGRNALNQSYVTGWGTKYSFNQHSRFYAHSIDPTHPQPPNGSIAGGPNTRLEDPYAAGLLAGCAAQFCYVDDHRSWSTNEVAINWNSALAQIASFLADQGPPT